MRTTMLVAVFAAMSVVACGPGAEVRRACEMFAEAGGVDAQNLTRQQKEWADLAEKVIQANPNLTEKQQDEQRAFGAGMAEKDVMKNRAAKQFVSARLTMSLAEVDRALERCPKK
jgi:hypothetical protein